jgi:hypothetical protein
MKNSKLVLSIVALFMFFTTGSFAQLGNFAKSDEKFYVKYVGNEAEYLYFQVELKEVDNGKNTFKINDKAEGEIYNQSWDAKSTVRTFKIEKKEDQVLTFSLHTNDKKYTKTFNITTKLITNLIVEEESYAALK